MALAPWLRKLPRKILPQASRDNGLFLDEPGFRFEMCRERMRVDRNGSPLAILDDRFAGRPCHAARLRFSRPPCTAAAHYRHRSDSSRGGTSACCCPTHRSPVPGKSPATSAASIPSATIGPTATSTSIQRTNRSGRDDSVAAHATSRSGIHEARWPSMPSLPSGRRCGSCDRHDWARRWTRICATCCCSLPAAIKLTSRGPVFYSQEREGLGGRRFRIYKFRTMRLDADQHQSTLRDYSEQDGPAFKMSHDPRTTWIGPLAAADEHGRAAAALERAARRNVAGRAATAADRRIVAMLALAAPEADGGARHDLHLANLGPQHGCL